MTDTHTEAHELGKVYTGASTSIDGYVSGPDNSGFDKLFRWYEARQAIDAGLVDEIFLDLEPVILGGGTPFFAPGKGYVLEGPVSAIESTSVTHLRYKVKYEAAETE